MRIALDISAALAGPSGIRFYIESLIGGLNRVSKDHEFLLYSSFWSRPERLESLRLPMGPPFKLAFKRFPQRLLLPADEILGVGIQERWLKAWGVDLFHGLGTIVPPLKTIPSIVTLHHVGGALDEPGRWGRFYFETLTQRSLQRARKVITVSSFSRDQAVGVYDLPPGTVTSILEGGPDPAFTTEGTAPAPAGLRAPYLLYVGGILERKNLVNLVLAFSRMLRDRPSLDVRLVLVGKKGRFAKVLEEQIEELELTDKILLPGAADLPRLVSLYRHSAAFVFPSLVEGFGFPVLEAMACGTPVIAANASAIPEVAGKGAFLVDPRDPDALAAALARALEDRAWTEELKTRGAARVKEFSWDRVAESTLAAYASLRPLPGHDSGVSS